MATIRHINEEEYAAKALELLNHRREGYVNYALSLLKQSMSPGQASDMINIEVTFFRVDFHFKNISVFFH